MRFIIVTGMSGAGKSTAMKMMEDVGFFCIDNLPILLLDKLVDFSSSLDADIQKVAVGIDIRNKEGLEKIESILTQFKERKVHYEILFLDAVDDVLIKRYKETRRNHPLAGTERVQKGIDEERKKLEFLKSEYQYTGGPLIEAEASCKLTDFTGIISLYNELSIDNIFDVVKLSTKSVCPIFTVVTRVVTFTLPASAIFMFAGSTHPLVASVTAFFL